MVGGEKLKLHEVKAEICAKFTIPDETAERCLRILEMYLQDNPEKYISGGDLFEGKVSPLRLEERGE